MGILIIHADHDTTASEWERIRSLVNDVNGKVVQSTEQPATQVTTQVTSPAPQATPVANDEKLHDPMGEYSDAEWQSFSPQKRGSIKRHRNGNDAPFVQAATVAPTPATPVSDAMTALMAKAGLATPEPQPQPQPEAPTVVVKPTVNAASELTPGQRTDLAIWANEKLQDQRKKDLANAFLAGKVTLSDLGAFPTKGGKSTLAKDIARVGKFNLVNA